MLQSNTFRSRSHKPESQVGYIYIQRTNKLQDIPRALEISAQHIFVYITRCTFEDEKQHHHRELST